MRVLLSWRLLEQRVLERQIIRDYSRWFGARHILCRGKWTFVWLNYHLYCSAMALTEQGDRGEWNRANWAFWKVWRGTAEGFILVMTLWTRTHCAKVVWNVAKSALWQDLMPKPAVNHLVDTFHHWKWAGTWIFVSLGLGSYTFSNALAIVRKNKRLLILPYTILLL